MLPTPRDAAHKEKAYGREKCNPAFAAPTLTIVADGAFCAQAAVVLGCDGEPIRNAFIGEPAEEVLEMVRWALSHEQDEKGFDAAQVLTAWAKKRERGAWSGRVPEPSPAMPDLNGKLAEALIRYWSENAHELAAVLDRVEAFLSANERS